MITGDIGIGQLIPLPLMGEGMARMLSIILAVANAPGGMVLIDEIENGLHHSVMVNIWKAIAEASQKADTQIFATTHSWECMKAAHEAFRTTEEYDFRLHRLDRIDDRIETVAYDRETLEAAIKAGLEVR
ncbi:MAG: ATP-binding protein [Armatimonadetes bacterium]|nr:ATP-binding protein [Armatimonadota bacterium]